MPAQTGQQELALKVRVNKDPSFQKFMAELDRLQKRRVSAKSDESGLPGGLNIARLKGVRGEFQKLNPAVDKMNKLFAESNFASKRMSEAMYTGEQRMRRLDKSYQNYYKTIKKTRGQLIPFQGDLLSILFGGMLLKNAFGGALKTLYNGYKEIIPLNSEFNRKTTQLAANWEFFKFSLFDAFAQSPLFDFLIEKAIGFIQVLSGMNDTTKMLLVTFLGLGVVVGWTAEMAANIGLAVVSIQNLITKAGGLSGIWAFLANPITLGITAAIGLATAALLTFKDSSPEAQKAWTAFTDSASKAMQAFGDLFIDIFKVMGVDVDTVTEALVWLGAEITGSLNKNLLKFAFVMNSISAGLKILYLGVTRIAEAVMEANKALLQIQLYMAFDDASIKKINDQIITTTAIITSLKNSINEVSNSTTATFENMTELNKLINTPTLTGAEAVAAYRTAKTDSANAATNTINQYYLSPTDVSTMKSKDYVLKRTWDAASGTGSI